MKAALANFQSLPLKDAARQLLATLGYKSDKFIAGVGSSPQAFLDLFSSGHAFDPAKALFPEWKSADLLFQITDQELSRESSLFTDTSIEAGLLKSYLTHLHQTLNAPSHPIRNRLLRLTADSPDLLAIIKQEGMV